MTETNSAGDQEKTGALRTDQNRLIFEEGFSFSGYERDSLYINSGTKKFKAISGVSGIDSISDGRAAVFADFDNDGDLDVFLTTLQGKAQLLFRNNVGQENNFLRVSLEGAASGRDAFGSVIRVKTSSGTLTKIKSGGAGYLAQHDPRVLFGLGTDAKVGSIEVTWPSGKTERFGGVPANSSVLLREGSSGASKRTTLTIVERKSQLPDPLTRAETLAQGLKIRLGQPLQNMSIKTLDGKRTTLAEHIRTGRRVLINLWATWCLPCAKEMPELQRIREGLSANGVDIIGINLDTAPNADVGGYLAGKKITYLNLIGGVAAIEKIYQTEALFVPLSILVDANGNVEDLFSGWSHETQLKLSTLAHLPIDPRGAAKPQPK